MKDRIIGGDLDGDPYELRKADALDTSVHGPAAVVWIEATRGALLDAERAALVAEFVLSAAGIDLVSAARKVVEAEKTATVYQSGAIQALAAELAKLDGVTR